MGWGQGGDCDGRLKGKVAKNGGRGAGVFGLCGLQVVYAGESVRRGYAVLWWVIWLSAPLRLFVCTSLFPLKRTIYGQHRLEHLMPAVFGAALALLVYVGDNRAMEKIGECPNRYAV